MKITPLAFMALFSQQEQTTIAGAGLQNPALLLWLLKLSAASEIEVADPNIAVAFGAMVAGGVISQSRADSVLAELQAMIPPKAPALTVVSSTAEAGTPQIDGRFWVTEAHTLSDGSVQTFNTLYDPGTDYNAIMAQRAASLNAQLAQDAAAS